MHQWVVMVPVDFSVYRSDCVHGLLYTTSVRSLNSNESVREQCSAASRRRCNNSKIVWMMRAHLYVYLASSIDKGAAMNTSLIAIIIRHLLQCSRRCGESNCLQQIGIGRADSTWQMMVVALIVCCGSTKSLYNSTVTVVDRPQFPTKRKKSPTEQNVVLASRYHSLQSRSDGYTSTILSSYWLHDCSGHAIRTI